MTNPRLQLRPETMSRAREAAEKVDRIALIEDMMVQLEWVTGKSARLLAEVWGCARSTVEGYSSEASRNIKRGFGSPEEAEGKILGYLEGFIEKCQTRTEEVVDAQGNVHVVHRPDHRTALRAAENIIEVLGVRAPNKLEIIERAQKLTDEQIAEQLRLQGYELRKLPEVVETTGALTDGQMGMAGARRS